MARYQLGRELSEREVISVVTWLAALTGSISQEDITPPELPGVGISQAIPGRPR
jgi:hypothetical protein